MACPLRLLFQKHAQCFHAWHCTALHQTTLISTNRKVSVTTALLANTGVLGNILIRQHVPRKRLTNRNDSNKLCFSQSIIYITVKNTKRIQLPYILEDSVRFI